MANLSRRNFMLASAAALTPVSAMVKAENITNPSSTATQKWDKTADVIVAGGGAAGTMAAIKAAEKGAKVILLEADRTLGGSSAISSGWIRSYGTKWHEKKGIKDTARAYEADIVGYGNGTRDPKKSKIIAERSKEFVDFLIDAGVPFTDDEDRFNGGETLRVVKAKGAGSAVMQGIIDVVKKNPNIEVITSGRMTDVILDEPGKKVIGVKATVRNKNIQIGAPSVVIATGGFGRNQEYIERFANQWAKTGRVMDINDKGDGLRIATNLGAGALNLNICMVCPTLEKTKQIFFSSAPVVNGAIFVNENGRRFTNEYVIYTQTPIDMLKQERVWEVMSIDMHDTVLSMIERGVAHKCDTVEDLAKFIGCPVEGLKKDIEEHNRQTALPPIERNDEFGRQAYGKPLTPPYYVAEIMPVMLETVGGFTIDHDSKVVTLMGNPVAEGLYGAGAAAFGEHFSKGYRSGEAYVYSGVTGMVAGENAAEHALKKK